MKKILITGANGFIGQYLCRECDKKGVDFLPLCNGRNYPDFNNRAREFDLDNYDQLVQYMQDYRPDTIVHLAAIASPVYGDSAAIYKVNTIGSENLLRAATTLDYKCKIVLISTAGVYGNQEVPLLSEDLRYNPMNHYSYSKMIMEILSRQYRSKLDVHIVRPFNIVGTGQTQAFLLPKLVSHFAQKAPEIRMGNLDAVRDYISVDFCVSVILDIAVSEDPMPRIINICAGKGHSCRQVIDLLEEITGHHPQIISDPSFIRENEVWSMVGDTTNLDRVVKGRYQTKPLDVILREMLQLAT